MAGGGREYEVVQRMQGTGFTLRTMDIGRDLASVHRIFEQGMRLYCDPLPKQSVVKRGWEQYIQEALKDDLSRIDEVYFSKGGHFWVIVDNRADDAIVGCVGVERLSATRCELRRMSVAPQARKGGLGLKLVRVVEEFAALRGFSELILSTGCIMAPAIGLYHRAGFECDRVEWAEGEFKELLDMAGEQFFYVKFRKPITTNAGRWVWAPFQPHETVTNPPTIVRPGGPVRKAKL